MSTKTLRKRIALVAVSALGAGMLSLVAVPAANASTAGVTASSLWVSSTNSTSGATVVTSGGGDPTLDKSVGFVAVTSSAVASYQVDQSNGTGVLAGYTSYATILNNSILTMATKSGASNYNSIVVSGGTLSGVSLESGNGGAYSGDRTTYVDTATNKAFAINVTPNAGVTTMTVASYEGASVAAATPTNGTLKGVWVFTIVAAGSSDAVSAAKSYITVDTGASNASTVDIASGFTLANGATGYISVFAKDAYNVNLVDSNHSYTVSATNGAKVSFSSAYPTASSHVTSGTRPTVVYVTQGTSNTAVTTDISVVVDGVNIGTKSLSFSGDITKITTSVLGIGAVGSGTSVNKLVAYKAYDAAGNRVALSAPAIKGTDSVVNSAAVTTAETATTTGVIGVNCATYGTNKGLYLAWVNAAGATIVSSPFAVSCAGDMYTYTATLDKKSYKQGEIATLTIKGLDVKGQPSNDITTIGSSTYKPAISGSYMTAVSAPVYTDYTTNGVITYQYIVGNTAGSYSMAVDLPLVTNPSANYTDSAKSIGYTIEGDGSVSNAAVLASIVQLIASINKQIAALQKALTKKK